MRTTSAAGEEGRGLLSEELDASAIIQRDNFSLVLLLQGLQGAEQHSLIQAMELCGRTETPINRVDRKKKKKNHIRHQTSFHCAGAGPGEAEGSEEQPSGRNTTVNPEWQLLQQTHPHAAASGTKPEGCRQMDTSHGSLRDSAGAGDKPKTPQSSGQTKSWALGRPVGSFKAQTKGDVHAEW